MAQDGHLYIRAQSLGQSCSLLKEVRLQLLGGQECCEVSRFVRFFFYSHFLHY